MKLHEIREARAAKVAEARTLLADHKELTADQKAKFDTLKAEIEGLEADEARQAFLDDAERRSGGTPVDKPQAQLEGAISLLEAVRAQVENRSLTGALREFNDEQNRQGTQSRGVLVPASIFETRAANTTTTAAGVVPDDFRPDQFIGLLRNSAIVRSLGVRTLANLRGDTVIPRQTGTTAATWLAEGDSLPDAAPLDFDTVTLRPHHVGALTEISRQALQQSNPDIERLVRDDFVQVIGLAVDKAILSGDGVKQPTGLLTAATGTGTLATLSWAAVLKIIEDLAVDHIAPNYWLATPQVITKLRSTLKSTTAGSAYLMENGAMAGIPVAGTQQLDNASGTEGRIIAGDFSELIVGTWGAVDVLANPYGSAYARGGVQVRIITTMDSAARRGEAFAVIDDVAI